jgi:hypothetical protein
MLTDIGPLAREFRANVSQSLPDTVEFDGFVRELLRNVSHLNGVVAHLNRLVSHLDK